MSNKVTDILTKTANKYAGNKDWQSKTKQVYLEHLSKHTEDEVSNVTDSIKKKEKGDSFNKKVDAETKYYTNRVQKTLSPYLKRRANLFVKKFITKNPDAQKAKIELYNKYIDNLVENACSQIKIAGQDIEEYRIGVEAVIRAYHDNLNNDPELKKAIDTNILTAMQNAAVAQVTKDMNSFNLQSALYIDTNSRLLGNKINNTMDPFTTLNIDNTIALSSTRVIKHISTIVANDTFGKLTNLPVIGHFFSTLQKKTQVEVSKGVEKLIKKQLSNFAPQIKSIKEYQKQMDRLQTEADQAINAAREKAKEYTQQLEQKAIDEIKKFINLDNLSIGGFKI